ncbi:hypothetical protein HWV62_28775 [Athelia sp. TMB]|nr:hypothetical protein HWV62_28775 [Athelia sp. TMB]
MQYSVHNHCSTCGNLLDPLSRNKGTRTPSNRNRLQQTCSNKFCRETHFYSEPLDEDVAEQIIQSLKGSPHTYSDLLTSSMDISRLINHSPARVRPIALQPPPAVPAILSTPATTAPLPQSRDTILLRLKQSDGRIRCANDTCQTKVTHKPRPGHKGCIGFFCKTCCIESVRAAWEKGTFVTRCTVPSHASAPAAYPLASGLLPPPVGAPEIERPREQDRPSNQQGAGIPPAPIEHTLGVHGDRPLVGPQTHHADPLSGMWRYVTEDWLEEKREAIRKDEKARSHKKTTAETKLQMHSGITVVVWFENGRLPFCTRLHPDSFPYFMPKHHSDIFTVLFSDSSKRVETWIPFEDAWEIQAPNVVRTVVSNEYLLYRTLPNGFHGEQLSDCPDLEKYKQLARGDQWSGGSGVGQKHERNDDDGAELRERASKKGARIGDNAQHTPSRLRSRSLSTPRSTSRSSRRSSLRSSLSRSRAVSSNASGSRSASNSLPVFTNVAVASLTESLLSSPLANNSVQGPGNERAWPGSFYAIDIFTGMERMAAMQRQRYPPVSREEAFKSVFGIDHWAPSTYKKHMKILNENQHLTPKFRALGRAPNATWKRFVFDANQAQTEAEEDSESEQDLEKTRASSVINVDDDSMGEQDDMAMETVVEVSDEEDTSSESNTTHWALMCAYCDEMLPFEPSDGLKEMRAVLDRKSVHDGCNGRDASPNPYHRYIRPFTSTLEYCERHRFESNFSDVLLNAIWAPALPVNFELLEPRVRSLIDILEGLTDYPWDNEFYQGLHMSIEATGESRGCGIAGQMSSFGQTGVGYYGERGQSIMFKVLSSHFRVEERVWGVSMMEFIHHVLIPETATRLIEEDLALVNATAADRKAAIKIKADSSKYGNLQNRLDW